MNEIVRKKERGITLIALVITIIVLLILAGISMAMLSGDNGILNRAVQAKEATRGGEVQETVRLAATNNAGVDYIGGTKQTRAEVISQLHRDGKLTDSEVETLEESNEIVIGGIKIDFSVLGSISNAKTLVQAFKDGEIKVGDYITNYNSTLNNSNATASLTTEETGFDGGTQTYKVNTNTTWRVLGLNKDETQLVITTGSPIKKEMDSSATDDWKKDPYLYLDRAEGWYNTNDELVSNNILDKVCAIYAGRYATDTKSMRIEDINTALGLTLDKTSNKLYKTADESKTAISAYQGFFGQSYTYKNGDYAPENYLKAKYPSKYGSLINKKSGDSVESTAFMYMYSDAGIVDQSSKLYEVLFKGTEKSEMKKCYWLASSGVSLRGSDFCRFGPGAVLGGRAGTGRALFHSVGRSYAKWLAVRPVVYLQSGVTVDDLSISPSGTEENWMTTLPDSFPSERLEYGQITE
ncbi:MAG: type II secretion system protein [Clostridiales bacterium]|nr:type II secretion system protein [Clostridiales bacterium]